ncbi:UNVERIFIED_CONTAM: putative ubiquitin-conjugating enzyme E2 23 [Sesamum radiatum]|uniref:Ubiquitin-conjugating enzyme E2 23 n=1 Tax=Sesamum radiatum TaxID=300843 RepID=A0AAW2S3B4_SESRA
MKADPLHLKPIGKNILEDGHFPYYPGQRVKATSSSVFKNSRWLSGLWKANRLEDSHDSAKDEPESTEVSDESDAEVAATVESTRNTKLIGNDSEVPRARMVKYQIIMSQLKDYAIVQCQLQRKVPMKLGLFIDGTINRAWIPCLIPIDSPGDHEFVAEQYVVEKAADSDEAVETRRVGVVKSVNAKDRTACVRWLKPVARAEDPREFDKEETVSVYELEGHPDYDYYLSWVGNITGLKDGDIEVTWADGMISTVGPQAIYVVGRDDDESIAAGSDASDDAASWETVEDDMDTVEDDMDNADEACCASVKFLCLDPLF